MSPLDENMAQDLGIYGGDWITVYVGLLKSGKSHSLLYLITSYGTYFLTTIYLVHNHLSALK